MPADHASYILGRCGHLCIPMRLNPCLCGWTTISVKGVFHGLWLSPIYSPPTTVIHQIDRTVSCKCPAVRVHYNTRHFARTLLGMHLKNMKNYSVSVGGIRRSRRFFFPPSPEASGPYASYMRTLRDVGG